MRTSSNLILTVVCGAAIGTAGARADEPQVDQQNSATATPATASETSRPLEVDGKPWKFMIAPYLWIPAQHGTITSGAVTAQVSMNVGQSWNALWDNFKFAGCLHLEANKDKWTVFGDIMYTNLGNEVKSVQVAVDQKMGIFELGGSYAVFDGALPGAAPDSTVKLRVEPLAGVRIWYLDVKISDPNRTVGPDEAWVDGFAGARCELSFNDAFSLSARADIGTGMSDMTWNILTMANYNLNRNFAIFAGWRWLSDDYKKGSGLDRFEYDIQFSGPFVGVKILF
ncbi:MAG: hypothetical protein ACREJD_12165 [Phycisphaerales bacterium]